MVKDMATGNTIHHQNLGQRIKYLLTRKSGGDIILIDMADVVTVLDVNTCMFAVTNQDYVLGFIKYNYMYKYS